MSTASCVLGNFSADDPAIPDFLEKLLETTSFELLQVHEFVRASVGRTSKSMTVFLGQVMKKMQMATVILKRGDEKSASQGYHQ